MCVVCVCVQRRDAARGEATVHDFPHRRRTGDIIHSRASVGVRSVGNARTRARAVFDMATLLLRKPWVMS
jgi:hypothetical protein